jgi:DNA adenine methylase
MGGEGRGGRGTPKTPMRETAPTMQLAKCHTERPVRVEPFQAGLLKWVGNKQRTAHEIASYFPEGFGTYYEPFIGSGAVLATLTPRRAVGSDTFKPLVEIWQTLHDSPDTLKQWYCDRWHQVTGGDKVKGYERVKKSYNSNPNAADLLFLCRSCYGGVVRFRKADGYMSTPCGIHAPIRPESFNWRVDEWHRRTQGAAFLCMEYEEAMDRARPGDLIYCDPPYSHSQAILYGAQSFSLDHLFRIIERCKRRRVFVAVSIDGTKRSGKHVCEIPIPDGLFERELFIEVGRSMLKRFQMDGRTLEQEIVSDRLLLTF